MNRIFKTACLTLCFALACAGAACGGKEEDSSYSQSALPSSEERVEPNCRIYPTEYEGIESLSDISAYAGEVSTNLPTRNGVVYSPYYTMTINGEEVPVYAARSANGIHSFAYIDVEVSDKAKDFALNAEVTLLSDSTVLSVKKPSVVVLPESSGVSARLEDKKVTFVIKEFGSYSFAFNKKPEEALTVFVTEKEDTQALFGNYEIEYLQPGDYSSADTKSATAFTQREKVYYFKAGRYKTDKISLPSDCVLYLERGAYIEVMPPEGGGSSSAMTAGAGENVKVAGRGLLDFSACCGGEVPEGYYNNKGGLIFTQVDNVSFSGITVINSQTWTLCFNDCEGISVKNCLFFAYRVYADGIMLSDCKNAVVEDSFIRTGDDAFETKSTTAQGLTDNVLFRNNAAWTDKAVAYGCIYESNHDTRNVRFENCSVGFALGTWSNHLGCCVIQMGNRKGAVMENISFENIEVYMSHNDGLLNVYIGGSGGRGEGYGIVKNIYFKNITAARNYGAFLNVRTYDSENCFIYDLYLDNILSNGVLLTEDNYLENGYISDKVTGGYNMEKYLHINTRTDEE